MIPCFNDNNLRVRFLVRVTLLLAACSLLGATLYYFHLRAILIRDALDTSEVILLEVESIRQYVRDVLRPAISGREPPDTFVIEAMSSTYVSLSIMRRFGEKMPGYSFRRASLNPLNPENLADAFEEEMFSWFEEDPSRTIWRGIVPRNGQLAFVTVVPDYMEKGCLRCHGDVKKAPAEIVRRYGTGGGYRFREGDLAGVDSVAIPVAAAFARIRRNSLLVFVVILSGAVLLIYLFNRLFNSLVIRRLLRVSRSLANGEGGPQPGQDELDLLRQSVAVLSRYVRAARKGAGLLPNFTGSCRVGAPITGGTLSWIHAGRDLRQERDVALKIGLNEVLINPLYAACLEAEFSLFTGFRHRCVPVVREARDAMLVLDPLPSTDLGEWIGSEDNRGRKRKAILEQICELVASLHTEGIVHHDLRAEVFLVRDGREIVLVDMGLASRQGVEDVILSSGLGPQGDPRTMAPEQLQGQRGNPLCDIYGVGVMVYRMVTRSMPFAMDTADGPGGWLRARKHLRPPSAHVAGLDPRLEKVILKAMAWDPAERYQWIEDLWEDLAQVL